MHSRRSGCFCILKEPLLKYSLWWITHATCVSVQIPEVNTILLSLLLNGSDSFADDCVSGGVAGAVALMRWEDLEVDKSLAKSSLLVGPFNELNNVLFARVDARITYYA